MAVFQGHSLFSSSKAPCNSGIKGWNFSQEFYLFALVDKCLSFLVKLRLKHIQILSKQANTFLSCLQLGRSIVTYSCINYLTSIRQFPYTRCNYSHLFSTVLRSSKAKNWKISFAKCTAAWTKKFFWTISINQVYISRLKFCSIENSVCNAVSKNFHAH